MRQTNGPSSFLRDEPNRRLRLRQRISGLLQDCGSERDDRDVSKLPGHARSARLASMGKME